jgi:predicted nuclease of predicted toxin-antitoxin system
MSNFNHCPLVWHFCGEVNTKKVEQIQERALRFIYEDYSASYHESYQGFKLT